MACNRRKGEPVPRTFVGGAELIRITEDASRIGPFPPETRMTKKKSTKKPPTRTPPRRLLEGLEQADALMRRERWPAAREVLADLARNYPREPEVLGRLVNVNCALNDTLGYQSAGERLLAVNPDEHDLRPALAAAYVQNGLPTLALRTLREFLCQSHGSRKANA